MVLLKMSISIPTAAAIRSSRPRSRLMSSEPTATTSSEWCTIECEVGPGFVGCALPQNFATVDALKGSPPDEQLRAIPFSPR
jgi:hypothetical protein